MKSTAQVTKTADAVIKDMRKVLFKHLNKIYPPDRFITGGRVSNWLFNAHYKPAILWAEDELYKAERERLVQNANNNNNIKSPSR